MPAQPRHTLPARPDLEQQKTRAKDLLKTLRAGDPDTFERLRQAHPRHAHTAAGSAAARDLKLADAQWVIAREYGFSAWPRLKAHIEALSGHGERHRPFETDAQYYKDRAFGLRSTFDSGEIGAARIIQRHLPRFAGAAESEVLGAPISQDEAEQVVAREHGFADFAGLEAHLAAMAAGAVREPFRDAFLAIIHGDRPALDEVLGAHPEILNAPGANGNRLLNLAVNQAQDALIDLLLERGVDPNLGNNKGTTPLHDAAYGGGKPGAVERIERLLAAGADVHAEAYGEGGTALAMALFWGHRQAAERLALEAVTPLNLRTAAGLGRLELMQRLFEADGSLRPEAGRRRQFHRPHSGFPAWRSSDDRQQILDEALTYAARNDRVEAMALLVQAGADPNAEPYNGTPLAWAVRTGRETAAAWLLDHGADVNGISDFGGVKLFTPLHLAGAWDGQPAMARLLLRRGADTAALHVEYNATPLSTARYFDNPEVAKIIEDHIAAASTALTIRPFVPAADFELCKRFYADLGFTKTFDDGKLAVFVLGETSFFLQNYVWDGVGDHYMLLLRVSDADAWWRTVEPLAKQYGVRARAPKDEPWGARVIHLNDPTGVLWHISQFR